MANPYIWGDLDRAVNDSTKIDDAIAAAVTAHNADAEAHLGDGQSLESHRAAEIIDHLAESVVNDKLATVARTYTAIVDPASDVDFDTIESALEYVIDKGGGNIFLKAGTYYLSGIVYWPINVNLIGEDVNSTTIVTDFDDDKYFLRGNGVDDATGNLYFDGITFQADSANVFWADWESAYGQGALEFRNCNFTGLGGYLVSSAQTLHFTDCHFILSAVAAIKQGGAVYMENCVFEPEAATGEKKLFGDYGEGQTYNITMISCRTDPGTQRKINYFADIIVYRSTFIGCEFIGWTDNTQYCAQSTFIGCYIENYANISIEMEPQETRFYGCRFNISGSGTKFILLGGTDGAAIMGCYNNKPFENTDGSVIIRNNGPDRDFQVMGNGDTAMNLGYNRMAQLTPNSTRTLTTTVPRAGESRTLIILTSGTTTYTLTFGTGFKTTGTLATGATSARRFVIEFISDGTYLIEKSRTVAIA